MRDGSTWLMQVIFWGQTRIASSVHPDLYHARYFFFWSFFYQLEFVNLNISYLVYHIRDLRIQNMFYSYFSIPCDLLSLPPTLKPVRHLAKKCKWLEEWGAYWSQNRRKAGGQLKLFLLCWLGDPARHPASKLQLGTSGACGEETWTLAPTACSSQWWPAETSEEDGQPRKTQVNSSNVMTWVISQ